MDETDRAIEPVVVGESEGGHAARRCLGYQGLGVGDPVEEAVAGVGV